MSTASRAALVTGGASGIGRATVARLLAEEWQVVVADLHSGNGAQVAEEFGEEFGGRVGFVRADVSEEADVAGAVAACVREFGRIDCGKSTVLSQVLLSASRQFVIGRK